MPIEPDTPSLHPDGAVRARENELRVLHEVALFGHLRLQELARMVWPHSASKSAAQEMCRRTVQRLVKERKELLPRKNGFGSRSFVLTRAGAARVRGVFDIAARDGYDIFSVSGRTLWHRSLATAYLAERLAGGERPYNEYAIANGFAPLSEADLRGATGKLPDGLVEVDPQERGYVRGVRLLDWIEVESAYKPPQQLEHVSKIAWDQLGRRIRGWQLDRLVVVVDASARHVGRFLKILSKVGKRHPPERYAEVLSSVILVRCRLSQPLTLVSWEAVSAYDIATSG